MANSFQEFLTVLKEKLNIADVIGSYLTLDRRGGNLWACCPFHHEKTPSFSVNELDRYYHCFGCGESGDVVKFVREIENVEFMDAVKMLAERAGMQLPQSGFDNEKTVELKRKRDQLLKIMNDCAHFYLNNLNSGNADEHLEYIEKRQIPRAIVRAFGLGASLNFNDLPKYLLSKGYSKQDILDSGAVNEVNGKLSDAQGGRLIFPVINQMDEVIAFGGRVLKKTDFAKYKNTKETLIFNKSKTLYNINLLKKLRKSEAIKRVIIVEGYMDTLSLYQGEFKNVVASMGTSLTQEQARLIKRYTDTVLISYDGDGAGQKANMRGLEILKSEGLNVKVVPLPDGLDPDDVIKQRGKQGYERCLDTAMPLIDYKLTMLERDFDVTRVDEKRRFVSEAIKLVRTADSAAEQEDLLKKLREKTGITYESLSRDLRSSPIKEETQTKTDIVRRDDGTAAIKASRFVAAAYLFGAKYADVNIDDVPFGDEVHTVIANYVKSKILLDERIQPAELFEFFDEGTAEYDELCKILDFSDGRLSAQTNEEYFYDCVKRLKIYDLDKKISVLRAQAKSEKEVTTARQILNKIQQLIQLKEKIKSGDIK